MVVDLALLGQVSVICVVIADEATGPVENTNGHGDTERQTKLLVQWGLLENGSGQNTRAGSDHFVIGGSLFVQVVERVGHKGVGSQGQWYRDKVSWGQLEKGQIPLCARSGGTHSVLEKSSHVHTAEENTGVHCNFRCLANSVSWNKFLRRVVENVRLRQLEIVRHVSLKRLNTLTPIKIVPIEILNLRPDRYLCDKNGCCKIPGSGARAPFFWHLLIIIKSRFWCQISKQRMREQLWAAFNWLGGTQILLSELLSQPGAKEPRWKDEIRPLEHGLINFLQTTDTHGWLLGHLNQKQYAADWGDFVSFSENLRETVESNGGDLLLVDTGDRHDGNGLSDLSQVNGQLSNDIFRHIPYDLITVGNHELYKADISKLEYDTMVPYYGERFISTNVKYLNDDNEWVVFGNNTHRYFQTSVNKLNVLALSFLFDFKWYNERIKVDPIDQVIKRRWFKRLMFEFQEKPVDVIVIFGHLPVTHQWPEFQLLHQLLRAYFPNVMIQFFGGHSHIRDFSILDAKSTGLQSGRYCETVGFLSIKDINDAVSPSNVFRSYIDFNKHSFIYHTNTTLDSFDTENGVEVTNKLTDIAAKLDLGETYGYIPHSFYTSAADYLHYDSKSLLRFLEDPVLTQLEPKSCHANEPVRSAFDNSRIVLINTGGIRYDMYKGPFNKNSLFTVSPFKNKWRVIPDVPYKYAMKLKDILNSGPIILANRSLKSPRQLALDSIPFAPLEMESQTHPKKASYGYVTHDDFGHDGDDTVHRALPNYYVPNVIQSFTDKQTANVDVVYYDFIEPFILKALQDSVGEKNEDLYLDLVDQVEFYNNCENDWNLGQLLKKYVEKHWS